MGVCTYDLRLSRMGVCTYDLWLLHGCVYI